MKKTGILMALLAAPVLAFAVGGDALGDMISGNGADFCRTQSALLAALRSKKAAKPPASRLFS